MTTTIINETAKALLISNGEKVAWIKKSWMREDGSFTPAAIKALEESKTSVEDYNNQTAEREAKDVAIDSFIIVKETEKAIGLSASTSFFCHVAEETMTATRTVWVPKSMIIDGRVAKWVISNKLSEIAENIRGARRYFSIDKK